MIGNIIAVRQRKVSILLSKVYTSFLLIYYSGQDSNGYLSYKNGKNNITRKFVLKTFLILAYYMPG